MARDHGPLCGFREWLVLKVKGGDNLHWAGLVELGLKISANKPSELQHKKAIAELGALMNEFFEFREHEGVAVIFCEYHRWKSRTRSLRGSAKKRKR
jgi:hypothetical protein